MATAPRTSTRPAAAAPQARPPAGRAVQAPPPPDPRDLDSWDAPTPDYMRGDAGMGTENIGREDLVLPRLKLIQALSPELQAYDDLRPGHFFHTQQEFSLGAEFVGVPVYMSKMAILWRPRNNGGGILARTDEQGYWDAPETNFPVQLDNGKQVTWRTGRHMDDQPGPGLRSLIRFGSSDPSDPNSVPAATEMYNYLIAVPSQRELAPALLSFQRSSKDVGRKLNTAIKRATYGGDGADKALWSLQIRFVSEVVHNRRNQEFYSLRCEAAGLTPPELYDGYRDFYKMYKEMGIANNRALENQDEGELAPSNGADQVPF